MISQNTILSNSRLAQLVERVTSNDEVSRSSRLMGTKPGSPGLLLLPRRSDADTGLQAVNHLLSVVVTSLKTLEHNLRRL